MRPGQRRGVSVLRELREPTRGRTGGDARRAAPHGGARGWNAPRHAHDHLVEPVQPTDRDTLRLTWKFAADCAEGACGGDWTIQVSSGPARGTFKVQSGQFAFSGTMSGVSLSVCNGVPGEGDRARMALNVNQARTIDGVWTATSLAGTFSEDFPAGGGCSSGTLDSFFGAKRRAA